MTREEVLLLVVSLRAFADEIDRWSDRELEMVRGFSVSMNAGEPVRVSKFMQLEKPVEFIKLSIDVEDVGKEHGK